MKSKKIYLAGPMEEVDDGGARWRSNIKSFLMIFDYTFFDPTVAEAKYTPAKYRNNWMGYMTAFKQWKVDDLPRFKRLMQKIIENDITSLRDSEYCLVYYDRETHKECYLKGGAGTIGEINECYMLKWAGKKAPKCILMSTIPIAEMPGWIIGCSDEIFFDWDKVKEYFIKRSD